MASLSRLGDWEPKLLIPGKQMKRVTPGFCQKGNIKGPNVLSGSMQGKFVSAQAIDIPRQYP